MFYILNKLQGFGNKNKIDIENKTAHPFGEILREITHTDSLLAVQAVQRSQACTCEACKYASMACYSLVEPCGLGAAAICNIDLQFIASSRHL